MPSKHILKILALVLCAALAAVAVCTLDRKGDAERTIPGAHDRRAQALVARVVDRHPHSTEAFTQGLVWSGGALYESTGGHGDSSLRQVDLGSGNVIRQVDLDGRFFAEGIALVEDRIIQLTWQSRKAFVYRTSDFERIAEFSYQGEGWGLCYDGKRLIMSDGSDKLQFRDPETFEPIGQVRVTINGRPQGRLNELECVDGQVYANVWQYEELVRIDPETGQVTAVIDASDLLDKTQHGRVDVLNGIAYLPDSGRFLLTGKLWPYLFEVEFVPR